MIEIYGNIPQRCEIEARYMIREKCTVRYAADHFGIGKTTVHKDVTERLKISDPDLYGRIRELLDLNKNERHLRGGDSTKEKYRKLRKRTP